MVRKVVAASVARISASARIHPAWKSRGSSLTFASLVLHNGGRRSFALLSPRRPSPSGSWRWCLSASSPTASRTATSRSCKWSEPTSPSHRMTSATSWLAASISRPARHRLEPTGSLAEASVRKVSRVVCRRVVSPARHDHPHRHHDRSVAETADRFSPHAGRPGQDERRR